MRWLYLSCPNLSLEQQLRYRDNADQACVMVDHAGQHVWLLNQQARQRGIQPGMGLSSANALAPEVIILEEDQKQSRAALSQLAALVHRRVANVALQPPHGLLLEIGSMRRLVDSVAELQQSLIALLAEQGFTGFASLGKTPLMAELLAAHQGGQPASANADQLCAVLHNLPITACGLPTPTLQALQRLGIRTLQSLLELPGAALGRRFGQDLLHWRSRLLGDIEDPQTWYVPPQQFYRQLDLQGEIEHTQGLVFPLSRILHDFQNYCHQTQQTTDQIQLRLHHRERPPIRLDLTSAQPLARADEWSELLRLRLERLTLFAPVHELEVRVRRLQSSRAAPEDWLQNTSARRVTPTTLLNRLSTRLGHQCIRQFELRADHRPHCRVQEIEAEGQLHPMQLTTSASPRPSWLLPEPQPVARNQLELLSPPERIQTGWWDLQGVRRDYYRARLKDNSLCWVFERPDQHWFIAGYFG